ncbi:MAG TPA: serine/threonine-protein kinase [Thermoanaerobaculia bacterium]|nr:serine/threonine-protein kinase [Thermoanaerobaculia bacterium]
MTLANGEQLGPYEILSPLGKGGMGEVYRARDTRLRREVALKLLPDAAAHDADSLHRFDRETRAVATLNHPNILAIHDTGSFRNVPYAVTELLEGETLADRLRTGPLNPQKAVEVACQVADGLAAAHEKGIIHRDIKPDNIFLTNEGRAKILDFGIARIEQPARTAGLSDTITSSRGGSSQFLVGTAGYMSPEQVRGKPIDGRTDIFSLGATFFEMLTGRRAFMRDSPVETLGAVLRDDPRKHVEVERIPDDLKAFVFRCLAKDPADRYQTARDLVLDLRSFQAEQLRQASERVTFRSEPPWKHRRPRMLLRAAGGIVLFALGLLAGSCWERSRQDLAARPATASAP